MLRTQSATSSDEAEGLIRQYLPEFKELSKAIPVVAEERLRTFEATLRAVAEKGTAAELAIILKYVKNIAAQDPVTKMTALHMAARAQNADTYFALHTHSINTNANDGATIGDANNKVPAQYWNLKRLEQMHSKNHALIAAVKGGLLALELMAGPNYMPVRESKPKTPPGHIAVYDKDGKFVRFVKLEDRVPLSQDDFRGLLGLPAAASSSPQVSRGTGDLADSKSADAASESLPVRKEQNEAFQDKLIAIIYDSLFVGSIQLFMSQELRSLAEIGKSENAGENNLEIALRRVAHSAKLPQKMEILTERANLVIRRKLQEFALTLELSAQEELSLLAGGDLDQFNEALVKHSGPEMLLDLANSTFIELFPNAQKDIESLVDNFLISMVMDSVEQRDANLKSNHEAFLADYNGKLEILLSGASIDSSLSSTPSSHEHSKSDLADSKSQTAGETSAGNELKDTEMHREVALALGRMFSPLLKIKIVELQFKSLSTNGNAGNVFGETRTAQQAAGAPLMDEIEDIMAENIIVLTSEFDDTVIAKLFSHIENNDQKAFLETFIDHGGCSKLEVRAGEVLKAAVPTATKENVQALAARLAEIVQSKRGLTPEESMGNTLSQCVIS